MQYIIKHPHLFLLNMSDDSLSDEDKALFRHIMHTVKPLIGNKKVKLTKELPQTKLKHSTSKILHSTSTPQLSLSNHYPEVVHPDSILSYCKQSIPRRRLIQLKTGKIAWQARLDLHGLRPDAAQDALCKFIEQQSLLANRCLLIIHGKGSPQGEAPILKNLVNYWLQQIPQILAFHSALARDGGSGALYVLLQRQRQ